MADPSTPRVTAEPPLRDWRLAPSATPGPRGEIAAALDTLGLHDTAFDPTRPIIATGHQAWFWHPGILAKDFAMAEACAGLGAQPVHLIVDHVANPALAVEVPVRRGDALVTEALRLGDEDLSVRTGQRPPLDAAQLGDAVARFERSVEGEVLVDLSGLTELPPGFDRLTSLADSITALQLYAVRHPCPGVFVLRTSSLACLPSFMSLVSRMLRDARRCVAAYNDAAAQVPQAGVAMLGVERDRVELPLWVLESGGALGRVFADLADSTPQLTREDGTPIEPIETNGIEHLPLAPKALALTAFMRSTLCDLFIHGTGGGLYEQVTARWWSAWIGTALAPLAVVTADVTLAVDVPVATYADLERAVWFRHHLPHNIDRHAADTASLDVSLISEKQQLLAAAQDDHTPPAKIAARRRLRAINRQLAQQHPGLIAQAEAAVARARQGVTNAESAARRDWCFALYPPETLAQLRDSFTNSPQTLG